MSGQVSSESVLLVTKTPRRQCLHKQSGCVWVFLRCMLMVWQVVILVGGGAFAWWVFYAPEGVRSAIEEMAAPVTGFCGSAFGWVQDKISGTCSVFLHNHLAIRLAAAFSHHHLVGPACVPSHCGTASGVRSMAARLTELLSEGMLHSFTVLILGPAECSAKPVAYLFSPVHEQSSAALWLTCCSCNIAAVQLAHISLARPQHA